MDKETLIRFIEAYADAKAIGNKTLISYAIENINSILDRIYAPTKDNANY
jgi:hypothetical protein